MLVSFWSPYAGKSSVSSSMLATAVSVATDYKIQCSIVQVGYEHSDLFSYFMPVERNVTGQVFENTGIDALLRSARGKAASNEEVMDCSFSFIERRLNVFNQTTVGTESVYLSNLKQSISGMFKALNSTFPINFVDVPAGVNEYSQLALEGSDVLVVCLPQSKQSIEKYFETFDFKGSKVLFVFGNYDSKRSLNTFNTALSFSKMLKFGDLCSIPHSTEYGNELDNGKAISFYLRNANCGSDSENYDFIRETRKTAGKVLKKCGIRKGVQ